MSDPDFIIPDRLFVAVVCFLTFNLTAMIGNMLPNLFTWVLLIYLFNM